MVRFGTAVVVLLVLALGVPKLMDPQSWILVQAVFQLGPVSGWRCAQSATYAYDPSQEKADATLLSEAPEALVLAQVPWLEVTEVDADLRGGDSLVKVEGLNADGGEDKRVYVLSPGSMQAVTVTLSVTVVNAQLTLCNAHLGGWQIVGEHELG